MAVEIFLLNLEIVSIDSVIQDNSSKANIVNIFKEKLVTTGSTTGGEIIHHIQFCYGDKSRDTYVCVSSKNMNEVNDLT